MILLLALAAALAQGADLLTFAAAVSRHGSLGEANPIMRWVYDLAGTPGVAAMKAAIILFVLLTVYAMAGARTPLWVPISILTFGIFAGVLGTVTNVLVL